MKKVTVIGGGPAGMMAAIAAAENGAEVTLLEKNEKLGKKLFITGKGRCNLTNACDISDFFGNVVNNGKFLYSAVYSFTNEDTCTFFEKSGLRLKEERGKRIFPASDHSSDVIRTLERRLRTAGVSVKLNCPVTSIDEIDADAIIIATGGLSYQSTGSTGDGFKWAEKSGHRLVPTNPSLVPLTVREDWIRRLEGLSLKNVTATVRDAGGKEISSEFGEMLFTARGVSGPVILTASSLINKYARKKSGFSVDGCTLSIDLKPALSFEQLDERVLRDFSAQINREFKNSLAGLLPARMIPVVVELSGIDQYKKVNEVTRVERQALAALLKSFPLTISGTEGYSQAVITSGGVDVRDISPSTMESKIVPGLYFAGEVMDVDAFTGGFNIQIALSTGYLAGTSAAEE